MMQLKTPLASGLFLVFAMLLSVTSSWAQTTLVVGVREDAPPFSYLESSNPEIYSGYVVQICTHVLEKMREGRNFEIKFSPLKPSTRFTELSEGRVDVLCDPATIDRERLTLPGVMVSQPIYLSGIGIATATRFNQWIAHWPCIGPIVGVVEGTTTRSTVIDQMAKDSRFGASFGEKIQQHPNVDQVTLSEQEADQFRRCKDKAEQDSVKLSRLNTEPMPDPIVMSFPDHFALAKAVCDQKVLFSVGDLEIIATALQIAKDKNPDCAFEVDPEVTSEERYGIFVHVSERMDDTDRLAIAFLRQLSIEIHKGRDSALISSFRNNFEVAKVSRTLDLFYWNVIAGGR